MKTPMQELIEKLKSQKERQISLMKNQLMIDTVDAVFIYAIENAESMLEKEKEVIIKTYNHAALHGCLVELDGSKPIAAQDYYNETFNIKEKWN